MTAHDLHHGAVGFLLKDASAGELLAAVRSAARGDAMISPRVTRRLLQMFAEPRPDRRSDAAQRLSVLTGKEHEVVVVAVGGGLTNTEIAVTLHMNEATVKTHVSRILAKLGLNNRVQPAILAHHAGLLG